jgi:predicted HTH domain antitoxin
MSLLQIEIPDHLFLAINETEDSLKNELKYEFAKLLFNKGKLTLEQSSEFTSIDIKTLMQKLSRDGIPVINYDSDDLESEVSLLT